MEKTMSGVKRREEDPERSGKKTIRQNIGLQNKLPKQSNEVTFPSCCNKRDYGPDHEEILLIAQTLTETSENSGLQFQFNIQNNCIALNSLWNNPIIDSQISLI